MTAKPTLPRVCTITLVAYFAATLRASSDVAKNGTIQLDAFTVAAKNDMTASDTAVNEQRTKPPQFLRGPRQL